jgi:hypothetical protein
LQRLEEMTVIQLTSFKIVSNPPNFDEMLLVVESYTALENKVSSLDAMCVNTDEMHAHIRRLCYRSFCAYTPQTLSTLAEVALSVPSARFVPVMCVCV